MLVHIFNENAEAGADALWHQELGVDGEANKSPVEGEDGLAEGRVLVGGAEGLHQELGLGGEALLSLEPG